MKGHRIAVEQCVATCVLFVFGAQVPQQKRLPQPKPLTRVEVLSLAALPLFTAYKLQLVQRRGISFSLTDEYARMLASVSDGRSAPALEEALRASRVTPSTEAEVPKETALLAHLTRCGELKNSQSSESEMECRAALALAPHDPLLLLLVGTSLEPNKRKEATAMYRQALTLDPDLVPGHVLLAGALFEEDPASRAEGFLEGMAALRLDPNSNEAMGLFGLLFGDGGVSDHDIAALRSQAHDRPDDPLPHFVLGLAYFNSDRSMQNAMAEFREAVRLDPGNGWYHYFIGGALSDSGDKTGALAELEKARKLDPENDMFRSEYESLLREVKK